MLNMINNRYRVIRELGKGGMGNVYLVEDTLQDDRVMALKLIRADLLRKRNLTQFRLEFGALSQLRHPNLVEVYDFGIIAESKEEITPTSQGYFFTMEYVEGEDLGEVAARHTVAEGYTWLYEITVQVCRALQYIHSRGFIHYDVKPGNIRIHPDGEVKLMDFGLIGQARGAVQLHVRGTPEYIAPELIRGGQADHRADLYSLGISLYEATTHKLPFSSDSSTMVLKKHVESKPEQPSDLVKEIPEALQTLILKLIEKEPANRYSSANAVIAAINTLVGTDFAVETKETKRGYVQSGKFVGREAELARLQGLLMRMMQGQGRLILVTGATGSGKTRLMRELRLSAQMQHVLVCTGKCYKQASSPYKPWISVLSQLISHSQACSTRALRTYGTALVKLMPELASLLPNTRDIVIKEKRDLLQATARFLLACETPLMVILEDLHYADIETVELLNYMGHRAARGQVLICGVYSNEELNETHPLTALISQARLISGREEAEAAKEEHPYDLLQLDTLTETEVMELIKSMLGVQELPPKLLPRIMVETGGNPLFIESVMHSLVEENLLSYDGEKWQIDLDSLTRLPASIQEAAQRRLKRLDRETLEVLQWAAVMGPWLNIEILIQVCELAPERVFQLIAQAVQRYHVLIISEQADEIIYSFSDEQMREAVYNTVPAESLIERHRRVGNLLRELHEENDIAELLAWHAERAGDIELALRYSRLAADKARQVHANESAIRHYSQALNLLHQASEEYDLATEYELLAGREACYRLIGDRQSQRQDLDKMEYLSGELGNITRQIEVIRRKVALATNLGNYTAAQNSAEAALELARQAGDRKLEADMLTSLGQVCFGQGTHEGARKYHELSLSIYREVGDREGEATSLRLFGDTARRAGELEQAREYYKQALVLYRELEYRPGECDTLNALGIVTADRAQARLYHEESLNIAQNIGNRDAQARSYNNLAVMYWGLGLYNRAREYSEKAVQLQREIGVSSSLAYDLETLGRIYLELGEYTQAREALEEGLALATDIGDRWTQAVYKMMLGRAALNQMQLIEAQELMLQSCDELRELDTPDVLSTALAWLGITHLSLGDWDAAYQYTSEAITHRGRAGNFGEYPPQNVYWLHYQVLRAVPQKEKFEDEAWDCLQAARDAMMSAIVSLSDEGLRRNYLNKVKINRDIITAWTRQAARRGEIEQEAEAASLLETEPDLKAQAAQAKDKLRRVLDISVRMNETLDAELLLNYVMDQVIELSGAERGFLVLMDENGRMDFKVARGMDQTEVEYTPGDVSYTVLGTVAQSKRPVLVQDALTDERFGKQGSVLDLNLRSVLCVPLISRTELIGMIYADNRSVSGRFSRDDINLMTIFANQAAIAIENARLHEETVRANKELESWAYTLEQRVAERTTELKQANEILARRAVQLETSSQVSQQITSILTQDELLNKVVNLIQDRFGYYFVGVWTLDGKNNCMIPRAVTGQSEALRHGANMRIPLNTSSIIIRAYETQECRLVEDVHEDPDYLATENLPATRSELALPLRMGNQVIGVLDIQSTVSQAFTADDKMVLQALADQIAIAIRNAQFYESEQSRRHFAESLESIGRALASTLNLREVPALILKLLVNVVPYERGVVLVQHNHTLSVIAQRGFPTEVREDDLDIYIREGDVYQQVVSSRRPLLVDDVTRISGWHQVDKFPLHKSWLGVPLISKDRVVGMISLTRCEPAAFSDNDTVLVSAFTAQAAIALENANLYEQVRQFNEQLEQRVQQRTSELNKAYHNLEQLDKTKSDFIDVAAHELRTPLTLVKGYTQMIETQMPSEIAPQMQEYLKSILTNTDRLHAIVNGMLEVAKIDNQVLDMHPHDVAISDVVNEVHTEFTLSLPERNLTLNFDSLDNLPTIQADPNLLFEVFYHLITNAIKYTPDGGSITVTGSALKDAELGDAVEVSVRDTGIGIDPEHQELIFEKFYQTGDIALHSSGLTKFKGGGPGLGLAIAKGVVTAHGGKIWVESDGSDEDKCPGSTFYVRLPLKPNKISKDAKDNTV